MRYLNKKLEYDVGEIVKWQKNFLQVKTGEEVCPNKCFFRGKEVHCLFYCRNSIGRSTYTHFEKLNEIETLVLTGGKL